jgi:hypothetical protein
MKEWMIVFCVITCCTFSYSHEEIEVGNVADPADCGCYFDKAGDEAYDLILFWSPYEVETHMILNKKTEIFKPIESISPNIMSESNVKFKIGNDRYSVSADINEYSTCADLEEIDGCEGSMYKGTVSVHENGSEKSINSDVIVYCGC